jgi:hypothetical protein
MTTVLVGQDSIDSDGDVDYGMERIEEIGRVVRQIEREAPPV